MQEGGRLRKAQQLAEAESQFEVAATMSQPGSAARAMAAYFWGLTRQDREYDEGALAPLVVALHCYGQQPSGTWSAAPAGAALGLSLLRLRRWAEAARVIERANGRMGGESENPKSLAAGHHNLAIAYTRNGDPRRGLEIARIAVGMRERLEGPYHPLTIETQLVEAFAQLETGDLDGAGALVRKAAKVVLAGPGEAHAVFADALLTEARRVAPQVTVVPVKRSRGAHCSS